MAVASEYKEAVLKQDILMARIMLKDSLLADTTFQQFHEMTEYAHKHSLNIWCSDKEDEESFSDSLEDLSGLMVGLVDYFSDRRVKHIQKMISRKYPPKPGIEPGIERNKTSYTKAGTRTPAPGMGRNETTAAGARARTPAPGMGRNETTAAGARARMPAPGMGRNETTAAGVKKDGNFLNGFVNKVSKEYREYREMQKSIRNIPAIERDIMQKGSFTSQELRKIKSEAQSIVRGCDELLKKAVNGIENKTGKGCRNFEEIRESIRKIRGIDSNIKKKEKVTPQDLQKIKSEAQSIVRGCDELLKKEKG